MNDNVSSFTLIQTKCDEIRTLLKKHRSDASLTQDDLAKWIGVSRKQIIEIENGSRFDLELLCKLSDKLGIDIRINYFIN